MVSVVSSSNAISALDSTLHVAPFGGNWYEPEGEERSGCYATTFFQLVFTKAHVRAMVKAVLKEDWELPLGTMTGVLLEETGGSAKTVSKRQTRNVACHVMGNK